MNKVIYGAQAIALGAYKSISEIHPDWKVICFLVTSLENNPNVLAGLPVKELSAYSKELSKKEKSNTQVIIATPENVMDTIEENLRGYGFNNIERMDSLAWAYLQEKAFSKSQLFSILSDYSGGKTMPKIQVFMAKFWKDKPLVNKEHIPDYMVPIQVGAALTDVRITDIVDCVGDNISSKNGNYSELTALYWIWKHIVKDNSYYGLAHYRRFLVMSNDDLAKLVSNDIDVVLPYPMPYEPSIEAHHKRYLSDVEWNAVQQALEELQPEYSLALNDILIQQYMYNYNIIIAKGHILKKYCEWLFPILERVETINNAEGPKPPNRFIGYVAETLETLYFMHHKSDMLITHTGCKFLS